MADSPGTTSPYERPRCGVEGCAVKERHWSHMTCARDPGMSVPHAPHVWDNEFVIYGPYLCPGKEDPWWEQAAGNAHSGNEADR